MCCLNYSRRSVIFTGMRSPVVVIVVFSFFDSNNKNTLLQGTLRKSRCIYTILRRFTKYSNGQKTLCTQNYGELPSLSNRFSCSEHMLLSKQQRVSDILLSNVQWIDFVSLILGVRTMWEQQRK